MNDPISLVIGIAILAGGYWCFLNYRKGYGATGGPSGFDFIKKKPTKLERNILLIEMIGLLVLGFFEILEGFVRINLF